MRISFGCCFVPYRSSRQSPLSGLQCFQDEHRFLPLTTALHGAQDIQHAGTLEVLLAPQIGCPIAKDLLDPCRLPDELRVARHQHGGGAAHVRRRHTGSVSNRVGITGRRRGSIFSPGATRSGLLRPSPVGPRLEKKLTP